MDKVKGASAALHSCCVARMASSLSFGRDPIATDQQMTGALPAGDKRGRKTVLY